MSRPLRLEHEGAIWHVTSRGNERREIFRDRNDRSSFLEILGETVFAARWRLHAYVLMMNHYHLLIETPERTLSRGVKRLNEQWAQHFNWRHARVGHLFQGRFTGILVHRETHLLELVRYIVLNPVRCGAVEYAFDYEWSNYRATAGLAAIPAWLDTDWTLSEFHTDPRIASETYRSFVADARASKYCPWESPDLIEIKAPEQRPRTVASFDCVVNAICTHFSETPEAIRQKNRRAARKALAQLAREACLMSFREIGEYLHATDWAAAKLAAAGRALEESDACYRNAMANAREALSRVFRV